MHFLAGKKIRLQWFLVKDGLILEGYVFDTNPFSKKCAKSTFCIWLNGIVILHFFWGWDQIENKFGDEATFNSSMLLKCKLVSIFKLQLATGGLLNLLSSAFILKKIYAVNQSFCHSPGKKYFLKLSHLYKALVPLSSYQKCQLVSILKPLHRENKNLLLPIFS